MGCVGCMDAKKRQRGDDQKDQKQEPKAPQYKHHESDVKQKDNYRPQDEKEVPQVNNAQTDKDDKFNSDKAYEKRKNNENIEKAKGQNLNVQNQDQYNGHHYPFHNRKQQELARQGNPNEEIKNNDPIQNGKVIHDKGQKNQEIYPQSGNHNETYLKPIKEANEKSNASYNNKSAKNSQVSERGSKSSISPQNQSYQRASKINASNTKGFEMDEPPKRASKMNASTRNDPEGRQKTSKMANTYYEGNNYNQDKQSNYNNINEENSKYYNEGNSSAYNNYYQRDRQKNIQNRQNNLQNKGNTLNLSKNHQVQEQNDRTYYQKPKRYQQCNDFKQGEQSQKRGNDLINQRSIKENQWNERSNQNYDKDRENQMNRSSSRIQNQKQQINHNRPQVFRNQEKVQYQGQHEYFQKSSKMNVQGSNRYNEGQNYQERNSRLNASKRSSRQGQGNNEAFDKMSKASGSRYNSKNNEQNFQKYEKLDLSKSNQYFNDNINESFQKGNKSKVNESRTNYINDNSLGPSGLNYSKSKVQKSQIPHQKYNFEKSKLDNSRNFAKSAVGNLDASNNSYKIEDNRGQGGLRLANEAPLQASRQNASRISSQVEQIVYNTATYNYNKPAYTRSNIGLDHKQKRQIFTSQVNNYSRPPLASKAGRSYHDPNNRPRDLQINEQSEAQINSTYNQSKLSNPGQSIINDRSEVRPYHRQPVPEEEAGDTMGFGWGSKILKL